MILTVCLQFPQFLKFNSVITVNWNAITMNQYMSNRITAVDYAYMLIYWKLLLGLYKWPNLKSKYNIISVIIFFQYQVSSYGYLLSEEGKSDKSVYHSLAVVFLVKSIQILL